MRIRDRHGAAHVEIGTHDVRFLDDGTTVSVVPTADRVRATVGARTWHATVAVDRDVVWVDIDGDAFACRLDPRAAASASDDALTTPMPATVVRIAVEPGQPVAAGDVLIALEAMKMELPIRAPRDGIVRAVHCHVGEIVEAGRALVEIE
jgi:biotin carboxyl carrier protein